MLLQWIHAVFLPLILSNKLLLTAVKEQKKKNFNGKFNLKSIISS